MTNARLSWGDGTRRTSACASMRSIAPVSVALDRSTILPSAPIVIGPITDSTDRMWACSAEMPRSLNARLCTRLTWRNSRTTAFARDVRKRSSCIRDNYLVYEMKSMEHGNHLRLTEQLRREIAGETPVRPAFTVDAERYRSAERH